MDPIETLSRCLAHMRATAAAVPDDEWGTVTNCAPWTADVLVGHVVASQLLWLGSIDGTQRVDVGQVMKPEAVDGDRLQRIDEVSAEAIEVWSGAGVLDRDLTGPFGTMPGRDTIVFPSIDALAHTWDLASSTGLDPDLPDEMLPVATDLISRAVNDTTRSFGLFAEPPSLTDDASATDRLMALAGRHRIR